VKDEPQHIQFEIEDNGIGMDQETREKAFSLFFSSKGTEGTGLGLFIANNIAQAHAGNISVESEIDRGTRFIVRIPRKHAD
jgi:signal transduction histidine kinase